MDRRLYYLNCFLFCLCINSKLIANVTKHSSTPKPHSLSIYTLASDSTSCIIPFNRIGNLMVIKAKADTVEGNFIVDTGAPGLVLNITYFRDYPVTTLHDGEQTSIAGGTATIMKT